MSKKRYKGQGGGSKPSIKQSNTQSIFSARVQYVILDEETNSEVFKQYGGWNGIGGILFKSLTDPSQFNGPNSSKFAKPLFPNLKNYPLVNEIVYVISLPSNTLESNTTATDYYYFQPINLWNSIHHNATPDSLGSNNLPESQQRDYEQVGAGSVRRVSDGGTEIPLGETFKEKLDIKPLLPYEGDIIYEGRWGQSIRFGSTVNNSNIINNWSTSGENGDPIIIIRNGQYEDGTEPWVPTVEDINQDMSDIWMTSTQAIPIEVASDNYKSFEEPPTAPNEYTGPQVIVSSGRILFNAKDDSILFSSKNSISLSSIKSVNIDTDTTSVNSKKILLGSKDADESVILGDKFLEDFSRLLDKLINLCQKLPTVGTPTPYTPNTAVAIAATQLLTVAQTMKNKTRQFKSKVTKTK